MYDLGKKLIIMLLIYLVIGALIFLYWDNVKEKAVEIALKGVLDSPGGCTSQEECFQYCLSHQEECDIWCSENPRFCDPTDKVGIPKEGGPGGCQTEEECIAYCKNIDNEQECKEFFGI